MYSVCTVYVQCMYSVCTVYVQWLYSVCTVAVQCMYSGCTGNLKVQTSVETTNNLLLNYMQGKSQQGKDLSDVWESREWKLDKTLEQKPSGKAARPTWKG